MSKRNVILLIIILVVIAAIAFGFFYFYQPANQNGGSTASTNFLANFLPFGGSKNTTPTNTTTPVNVSGYVPPVNETTAPISKLIRVSSFPVAGYGVFMKERFKSIVLME